MHFEILGAIRAVETIAVGTGIRESARLRKIYGSARWRKRKGVAEIRLLPGGSIVTAEIHWYEASNLGKKEFKIKRLL